MAKTRLGLGVLSMSCALGSALLGGVVASAGSAEKPRRPSGGEGSERAVPASSCPSGMVQIPAGTYSMGSDDGDADEKPAHQVTVAGFCMDRTEVTVTAYADCVRRANCPPAPVTAEGAGIKEEDGEFDSLFCNGTRADRGQHPINCVDWNQADTYCRAVGKRLPTEEEWEYAARGQDGRKYPWGNAEPSPSLLNALGTECVAMGVRLGRPGWEPMYDGSDGWETTAPVGSYAAGASPFGVLDMAGNVWEQTSSAYSQDYGREPANDRRVHRGGGWGFGDPSSVRAANRGESEPTYRGADLGFRCASRLDPLPQD
jgi:eukaryotic-like serine/threonine-protein kinase